ncbi:MAG: hypothetical protein DMG22_07375 [Acidobacteria bacterium]|nr:MAG: hypothetical protein DMG22_07375 [Acidobacteriota bacterium]
MRLKVSTALTLLMFPACSIPVWGQQGCHPPSALLNPGENMFNEEQEEALGDIMADQVVRSLRTSRCLPTNWGMP